MSQVIIHFIVSVIHHLPKTVFNRDLVILDDSFIDQPAYLANSISGSSVGAITHLSLDQMIPSEPPIWYVASAHLSFLFVQIPIAGAVTVVVEQ